MCILSWALTIVKITTLFSPQTSLPPFLLDFPDGTQNQDSTPAEALSLPTKTK